MEHRLWALGLQQQLRHVGPAVVAHRFNSCVQGLSWWDPPGSGIELISPALAGGSLPPSHQGSPNVFLKGQDNSNQINNWSFIKEI